METGDFILPFSIQVDHPSINTQTPLNPNVEEEEETDDDYEPYIHLTYYPSGNLESKTYFMEEGHYTIHRKDGPAETFYYDCSPPKVKSERWRRVHDMHRNVNDGAAFVIFDENGKATYEEFWEDDRRNKNYKKCVPSTQIFQD